ncbi:MAG: glycosyltransferase family 9 protein [Saprospiraceae bacterium]
MRILVIQTAFIGDVILATSIIESLHQNSPDSKIDFLLRKGNESLLKNHPHLNKILIFDKKNGKYRNLINLIIDIRKNKYDLVINIQRFFTTGLITALSGSKKTIGFKKNPLSIFFTHRIAHNISKNDDFVHETERNLDLLKPIFSVTYSKPKLYPSSEDFHIIPDLEYICLAPGSVWKTKQWPIEKWIELCDNIPEKYHIYIIGSKDDSSVANKIISATNKIK